VRIFSFRFHSAFIWPRYGDDVSDERPAAVRIFGGLSAIAVLLVALVVGVARLGAHPYAGDGARLLSDGRYRSAVRALLAAVARDSGDARAHYHLGLAYSRLGVHAGAVRQLEHAVRLEPRQAPFHAALARAYRDAGNTERALRELEAAARLDPSEPDYHVALAGLLLARGAAARAFEPARRAARLRPHSPEIDLLFATILDRMGPRGATSRVSEEVRRLNDDGLLAEMTRVPWRQAALDERSIQ
jgi:Flp pilus assembly protein TadD